MQLCRCQCYCPWGSILDYSGLIHDRMESRQIVGSKSRGHTVGSKKVSGIRKGWCAVCDPNLSLNQWVASWYFIPLMITCQTNLIDTIDLLITITIKSFVSIFFIHWLRYIYWTYIAVHDMNNLRFLCWRYWVVQNQGGQCKWLHSKDHSQSDIHLFLKALKESITVCLHDAHHLIKHFSEFLRWMDLLGKLWHSIWHDA